MEVRWHQLNGELARLRKGDRLLKVKNVGLCSLLLLALGGCDSDQRAGKTQAVPQSETAKEREQSLAPPKNHQPDSKSNSAGEGKSAADGKSDSKKDKESGAAPAELSCAKGMTLVPAGSFWVGTEREVYDREENPRFSTKVAAFCAGTYEVTAQEYEQCVSEGKCKALTGTNKTCNTVAKGREKHPVNCIDYFQAEQVCKWQGARLPTEIEWEYMARGGAEMREFPWGSEEPDGHTCWKHAGSCEVGEFPAAAFGLYDVVGNVWEWTSSNWGHYPWPSVDDSKKVYRGGSWSRRFAKWMRPSLRNRLDPKKSGSHLGVRCVMRPEASVCAYGEDETGQCRHGIEEVMCLGKEKWNGIRCAKPGDEARCPAGTHEEAGHGCVRERVSGSVDQELDTESVTRSRSPQFDADCQANTPDKPLAYRFVGGGHLARNAVGAKLGCKNRDVGVGFNSSCCPP